MNNLLLEVPLQPDFSGDIMCGSDEIVNKFYEPLRRAYPNYISRTMIGTDTSGQYQMWLYDFCPENYEVCVFLQSGSPFRPEVLSDLNPFRYIPEHLFLPSRSCRGRILRCLRILYAATDIPQEHTWPWNMYVPRSYRIQSRSDTLCLFL